MLSHFTLAILYSSQSYQELDLLKFHPQFFKTQFSAQLEMPSKVSVPDFTRVSLQP
jgi:hypothetical protein